MLLSLLLLLLNFLLFLNYISSPLFCYHNFPPSVVNGYFDLLRIVILSFHVFLLPLIILFYILCYLLIVLWIYLPEFGSLFLLYLLLVSSSPFYLVPSFFLL